MNDHKTPAASAFHHILEVYLTDRDIDTLMTLVTDDICSIGTGDHELCFGSDEMRALYMQEVAGLPMSIPYTVSDYRESSPAPGCYTCFAMVDTVLVVDEEEVHLTARLTITFVERDGTLLASLLHMSVANQEQEADEFFPVQKSLSDELLFHNEVCGVIQYRLYPDETFVITRINREAARILQIEQKDVLQQRHFPLASMIWHEESFVADRRIALDIGESSEPKEYRAVNQNGEVTWVVGYSSALELGEDDNGHGYKLLQSILMDIDERKKAELKYQEYLLNEQMDALLRDVSNTLKGLGLGLWHCEDDPGHGTLLYMDESAADAVGLTADTDPQEAFQELSKCLYPDDVELFNRYFHDIKANGRAECTYRYLHKTRGVRYIRCSGWWDGAQRKGVHLDVTEQIETEKRYQKALEEALAAARQASVAKTQFLSNMSHDIRTPMNAIVGLTAIASTHLDDRARISDCLHKITLSSRHLLGLINEVLDMSKIESGKIELHDETFSLSDFLETVLEMCRLQIKTRGHEITVSTHGIEHEMVTGDSQRLQQVFMNLISNSIKYTPDGGMIRLSITEKPTNRPNIGCYVFVLEDNGIGMTKEFQARIFEPFTRSEDERASKEQGTGLGMAITKNIIEMMNGTIAVDSTPDVGTKFTVTFFLKLPPQTHDESIGHLADLPILVADDDEIACQSTCALLAELGMKGEWVLSGKEAVERVAARYHTEDSFYAVILDWRMPEMDGIATAKAIRSRLGDEIPIVILSAYDWADIEQEARAAGVNAFIGKPLFKSRLTHLFNGLLGQDPAAEPESALVALDEADFSGFRVLLVEDNELNAEIATELLEMTGLTVERAENGKEAVDRMLDVADGYYSLVLMDIQMPVMNGYDAVRAIRSFDRDYTKSVPIVAMTANAFAEDVQAARTVGMNGHIAKPLDLDQLRGVLQKWISL